MEPLMMNTLHLQVTKSSFEELTQINGLKWNTLFFKKIVCLPQMYAFGKRRKNGYHPGNRGCEL